MRLLTTFVIYRSKKKCIYMITRNSEMTLTLFIESLHYSSLNPPPLRIILKSLTGRDVWLSIGLNSTRWDRKLPELCSRIGSDNLPPGFGPIWRHTDGNTDDSPKDRLDLYDGEELRFRLIVVFIVVLPTGRTADASSFAGSSLTSHDNNASFSESCAA